MELSYEVRGYKSRVDFDNHNFRVLDEDIDNKSEAIELGRAYLKSGKYRVVKVQSSDREWIMILQNKNS